MNNPKCIYKVKTKRYGTIYLDEGAYRDYLKGELWICFEPGKPVKSQVTDNCPATAGEEAISLRTKAQNNDVLEVYRNRFESQPKPPYKDKMETIKIDEMILSVRSSNALMRAGIFTFKELKLAIDNPNGLKKIRNLGLKSENEILCKFFSACYYQLNEYEKATFWQECIDNAQMTTK